MATVVNERDVLMAAAPARVVNVVSPGNVTPLALRGISLAAPTAAFRIATNGDPSPSAVTITATLKGIDVSATVTWAVTVGTGTLTGTGLSRTLAYANMTSDFVTITASVVVGGLTYTDQLSFMKLHDGSVGGEGTRGSLAVARAITGTSWSNTEALAALTAAGATSAISTDTCTLYNASVNYAEMRRYDGTNWVTVGSSMPGSVMMNGSITTEKLLVTGLGIALNSDPNTQDVTAWSGSGISVISDTTAPNGSSALQCVGQGTAVLSRRFPLDSTQSYRVRTWAKQVSGASSMYLAVAFYDAAGTLISGSSSPSGWADHGDYHYYGLVGVSAPGTWTEYSASFGADEVKGIPAGAKFASLGLISNFSAAGTQLVSGMICHLKTRGEMVVDGSITANKIDARGLEIRDAAGNTILSAGSALNWAKLGGPSQNLTGLGYQGDLDATRGATIGVDLGGQITQSNAPSLIEDLAIPGVKIGSIMNSSDWDGEVNPDGTIQTAGTRGWVLAKGNGTAGSSKMEVDAADIRGTLNVGQININDEKSGFGNSGHNLGTGSAVTSISAVNADAIRFCDITSTDHAISAFVTGTLSIYSTSNAATQFETYLSIIATNGAGTVSVYGETVMGSLPGNGGRYNSASGMYVYRVPFNLSWFFGGSFISKSTSYAPGVSGPGSFTPSRNENFLPAGPWKLALNTTAIAFVPGTETQSACIGYLRIALSGGAFSIPGALRYDPPMSWGGAT